MPSLLIVTAILAARPGLALNADASPPPELEAAALDLVGSTYGHITVTGVAANAAPSRPYMPNVVALAVNLEHDEPVGIPEAKVIALSLLVGILREWDAGLYVLHATGTVRAAGGEECPLLAPTETLMRGELPVPCEA